MINNNDLARNKLIEINSQGLLLKAISVNVGISESDLSKFKGGMNCIKESDINKLYQYLSEVVIPQWNKVISEKQMSLRERLLASKNKSK